MTQHIEEARKTYRNGCNYPLETPVADGALILAIAAALAAAEERGRGEWQTIDTCPIREAVDLWCVYGEEPFAMYDGGASIGKLVSNRFKSAEYGFFGNQSNDGVPQRDAPDLRPVAWRKAVPSCPPDLIAKALGVPLTREEANAITKEPTP